MLSLYNEYVLCTLSIYTTNFILRKYNFTLPIYYLNENYTTDTTKYYGILQILLIYM